MALPPAPRRFAAGIVRIAAVALVVVAVAACGRRGPAPTDAASEAGTCPVGPSTPDLSTPSAALGAAAKALCAGDLAALDACLTPEAAEAVRRDLLAWRTVLVDPALASRVRIPSPCDDAEKATYRAAFGGDPAGLLHLLARASQAAVAVDSRVEVAATGTADRVEGDRVLPDGTRRRAVLVRRDGAWRVARLAL